MEKTVILQPNAFLVNVDGKNYSNCDILGSFYDVVYKKELTEVDKDEIVGKAKEASGK